MLILFLGIMNSLPIVYFDTTFKRLDGLIILRQKILTTSDHVDL